MSKGSGRTRGAKNSHSTSTPPVEFSGTVNLGGSGKNVEIVVGALENSRSISSIADRATVKELQRGISRFEAKIGIKERSVRVGNLDKMNALGVTYVARDGKSMGILLNQRFFDRKKSTIENDVVQNHYNTGFKNRTNAPLQHTITHELSHAVWNAGMRSKSALGAKKEISALYGKWVKDKKKKGYGEYAKTNLSEFYAEGMTKAIHGNADKYTRKLVHITKKYGL